MLGRGVAARLREAGPRCLVSQGVRDLVGAADLFVLNLERCISDRGEPWPSPGKPFFFRGPPVAVEALRWLGVDVVGAGADEEWARQPVVVDAGGARIGILGLTDHPPDFAAVPDRSGAA